MGIQVKIPAVGESVTEVTIASWAKNDGEAVQMDEVIAELESDKATFELTAPEAGVLKILRKAGESVPVGELVCEIEPNGAPKKTSSAQAPESKTKEKEKAPEPASTGSTPPAVPKKSTVTGAVKEMRVPEVGESVTEVTISSWLKKEGDFVQLDEIIAEVESDKATFELPAEAQGILRIVARENETLQIGGLICRIEVAEGAPEKRSAQSATSADATPKDVSYAAGHPSPAAAKILDEKDIKPEGVKGTGVGGRITREDAARNGLRLSFLSELGLVLLQ